MPAPLLLLPRYKPTPAGLILLDTFTDPDGTLLTQHRMDRGYGWTAQPNNNLTITSGRAVSTPNQSLAANAYRAQDVYVKCTVQRPSGAANLGLMVHHIDVNNQYFVRLSSTILFELIERIGGVDTTVATLAGSWANAVDHLIEVWLRPGSIQAAIDGAAFASPYSPTPYLAAATRYGLRSSGTTAQFDGFEVDSL